MMGESASVMNLLALFYRRSGRDNDALQLRDETLPLRLKVTGPEHPDTLSTMNNLAFSYADAGRRDEGVKLRTELEALAPLRGMALKELRCFNTKVADLSPLQGMPLEPLHVSGTPVTDLTPLRGMGLLTLKLHNCPQLTDLTPLAEAKTLTILTLPPNAKDIEFLRTFPKLERLGTQDAKNGGGLPGQPAAEFWKEWDAGRK